ncbi:hypothetical protein O3M35_004193 [Rhynocoris fuscipes]|uniref:MHC class II antigen n=1 Tax=Rhynocoris fuscipes TaxID=488301 RepID=A0AAW1CML3_9HEMI
MCKIDVLRVYGFVFTGSQESILSSDAEGFIAEEYVPDNRSEHSVTLHNEQEVNICRVSSVDDS